MGYSYNLGFEANFESGTIRRFPPPLPTAQNFLNFMQFFAKFGKIICWRPPGGLAPPPTGNPLSAPAMGSGSRLLYFEAQKEHGEDVENTGNFALMGVWHPCKKLSSK